MSRKPWQVVRLYPGGGVDMGESYDVRPDPRPEPAPLPEKWRGPPAR